MDSIFGREKEEPSSRGRSLNSPETPASSGSMQNGSTKSVDRSLAYAGLYEMSPDHHALLGRSPACDNMYFANGSSGHGVMHSPAIGAIIADMITGREPAIDVRVLRPSRFDEGEGIAFADLL